MDIGEAITLLKSGKAVSRLAWADETGKVKRVLLFFPEQTTGFITRGSEEPELMVSSAHIIELRKPENTTIPWTATYEDLLAEDWAVAEN